MYPFSEFILLLMQAILAAQVLMTAEGGGETSGIFSLNFTASVAYWIALSDCDR